MVMSSYLLEYASLPTGYLQSRSSEVPSRRPAMGELAGASDRKLATILAGSDPGWVKAD
jgi:hypothetical protein